MIALLNIHEERHFPPHLSLVTPLVVPYEIRDPVRNQPTLFPQLPRRGRDDARIAGLAPPAWQLPEECLEGVGGALEKQDALGMDHDGGCYEVGYGYFVGVVSREVAF